MQSFLMRSMKTMIRLHRSAGWLESSLGTYVRRYHFPRLRPIFDAQRTKRTIMHFADNVGLDQRAQLCSLIWVFSVSWHLTQCPLILKRTTKAQISLRLCAGWSGPALSANYITGLFVRCAPFNEVPNILSLPTIGICTACEYCV